MPDTLQEEELELTEDLENQPEPTPEEVVDDPAEDTEEALDDEPAYKEPAEERIPKSRFDAERARADTLEQVLNTLRNQQQPAPAPAAQQTADPYAGYTPERKQWAEFIKQEAATEIDRRVREQIAEIQKQAIEPLRRNSIEVQERIDEQDTRRKFRDYDSVKDLVNQTRAEWFQRYGVVAPRDVAYHYVKGTQASKVTANSRTAAVRANAKQGASVPNKPPAKKIAAKGPISLNDVANMSLEDAERWLTQTNAKF